jgi:putative addiction module killer protein
MKTMESQEREILIYETDAGNAPYSDWLRGLRDTQGRSSIRSRIARLRAGLFGDCKTVGEGVQELRIDVGPGYRVYIGQDELTTILLLCGGSKKGQQRDIEAAKAYWKHYRSTKNG